MEFWALVRWLAIGCGPRNQPQKRQLPTPNEKKIAAEEKEAKKMLLLMDKDNSGKVSKRSL